VSELPVKEWWGEPAQRGFRQLFAVREELFHGRSLYQEMRVVSTVPFGRMLVLDGAVQTTEADEFIYHEMLVHVPLLHVPRPQDVLIIGGGDGGALRRVLMHDVSSVTMVEIDSEVVRISREFLPSVSAGAFEDKRAHLVIGDGAAYLRDATPESFDAIIVDSTDPVGPARVLFEDDFFRHAYRALKPGGVYVTQVGSPLLLPGELREAHKGLSRVFPQCRAYLAGIPSYPAVLLGFLMAGKDPFSWPSQAEIERRWQARGLETGYLTAEVAVAAFALPAYVQAIMAGGDLSRLPFPVSRA